MRRSTIALVLYFLALLFAAMAVVTYLFTKQVSALLLGGLAALSIALGATSVRLGQRN
jgi:hypothetical protein